MELDGKCTVIAQLKRQVMLLEGYGHAGRGALATTPLGLIDAAFPQGRFPTGVTHEFISRSGAGAAATGGFIAGLLAGLMQQGKACLWIGSGRQVFPAGLTLFGIQPDRVIFVDLRNDKEALWAVEEALRCSAVAAVVGEVQEISFAASRRLQLAVERSHVTGLLHRRSPRSEHPLACVSRWQITPAASVADDGMPGVGFPRWQVRLVRVRNGRPGSWEVEWRPGGLLVIPQPAPVVIPEQKRRYG